MTALDPAPVRSLAAANLVCLASMLVWAAGLPAAELVIDLVPPIALTAMRTALAAAFLLPLWWAVEGAGAMGRAHWGKGILVGGICIGFGAVFLVIAQAATDPVTVSVITATMPVIGIALECLLDGRRLTLALVAGLVLSLAGGLLAYGAGMGGLELGIGAAAALASVTAFTWGSRATVTSFPDLTPLGRTTVTVTGAAICTAVAAAIHSMLGAPPIEWAAFGWREAGALVVFGVGSLAVSQVLWIMAVGQLGIGLSSLHMNAVPFYVMLIMFALGAGWNWAQAAGAGVVVAGVLIAQGLLPRLLPAWRRR